MVLWILVAVVAGALAYVRVAPSDPGRWHQMPEITEDRTGAGSASRVVAAGPDGLARLAEVASGWPRTAVLAGSVEEGKITWVSRSAAIGFPDYITAEQSGDSLRVFSRLRFGRRDFGVNAKRLDVWLKSAGLGS